MQHISTQNKPIHTNAQENMQNNVYVETEGVSK